MNKTLNLAWLFPSTLYLHGERGNILAFKKLAQDNGVNLNINTIELGDSFNPLDYDIIYCPAGENAQAESVIDNLKDKKEDLKKFIDSGKPLIVTGNSLNFFGNKIVRKNLEDINGLGIIDINSIEKEAPYGDDLYFKTIYNNQEFEIFGNQIQLTDINLENDEAFGKLIYGYGNNGNDINEGIQVKNSIFTNTLGPLFILNPWLTIEVLNVALNNKNLEPISNNNSFELEKKSLNSKIKYINNKKTNLKNT